MATRRIYPRFFWLLSVVPAGRHKLSCRINNELLFIYLAPVTGRRITEFRHIAKPYRCTPLKPTMQKITVIFFIATLLGCSNNQTNTDKNEAVTSDTTTFVAQPLQIDNGVEEGWGADIRLSIVEKTESDTANIYKALSSYNGQQLGLLVTIPKRKEGNKGFGQGISLRSIGSPSDFLLRTLHKLYKQTVDTTATFAKDINVTYVNLKEFAKAVAVQEGQYTAANEYKLFFEGKSDEDYAEIYLNVNPIDNWIELREKDEEYRPILLRFLRQ